MVVGIALCKYVFVLACRSLVTTYSAQMIFAGFAIDAKLAQSNSLNFEQSSLKTDAASTTPKHMVPARYALYQAIRPFSHKHLVFPYFSFLQIRTVVIQLHAVVVFAVCAAFTFLIQSNISNLVHIIIYINNILLYSL